MTLQDKINHYLISYGTFYEAIVDRFEDTFILHKFPIIVRIKGPNNFRAVFLGESLLNKLEKVNSSQEIDDIFQARDPECYYVTSYDEFLVEQENGIAWSKYRFDGTQYKTEEEAEEAKIKYGLVLCGVDWYSGGRRREPLVQTEQRIREGTVNHPYGGEKW